MAAIETVRSRPPDALRAPGRPVTADPVALLRALLGRRLVVPEVYDVMERVQAIMVGGWAAAHGGHR